MILSSMYSNFLTRNKYAMAILISMGSSLLSSILSLYKLPLFSDAAYYASSDIFIGPSIETPSASQEALGVVFLEALSSGIPIITTKTAGIVDTITDQETGIIVAQKDSEAIARAVQTIIQNENLRAKLIKQGLSLTKNRFAWDGIAEPFDDLFEKILNSKHYG